MVTIGKYKIENVSELSGRRLSGSVFELRTDARGRDSWVHVAHVIRRAGESWKAAADRVLESENNGN